jgi:hypothetical protein
MLTTETRCPGCERHFTPRGLAQHISKSRDARCRDVGASLASQVLAVSFPHMVSPQPSGPIPLSEASGGDRPNDNLDPQSTIGEFTVTRAAHWIAKKFR